MQSTIEKTDTELKNDVLSELKYDPSVKVSDIGVLAKNGTVTLNGYATSYNEKWEAVHATKRVAGVKAIADDIKIQPPASYHRTDTDIAAAAINQIEWSTTIPNGTVQATVRDGWITLDGEVEWWYQKNAAGSLVKQMAGVKGVTNSISISPKVTKKAVETDIKAAFKRSAMLDAEHIRVETSGNNVILHGQVRNYSEYDEAERVAWSEAGVSSVDNRLEVDWMF
ncbi:BON domain-containing protein [Chamaesiphon minutus]|uniref:Putative periplasmic or secreted lipoprotein n=1 Tax=Chamaesiphon minutus (strain ATCC 27169 / PCC 6605) TaxID=1173020 RepID=K9UDW4_CHAP6|nr:BON domain-containing protein [Chamaesiphon minutus]AFY92394.1 putative periplasmic or secreted lipoprotein [Chamaesiphon minutus PCC 6605]